MNKWKEGIVYLDNNLIITPGYTFSDFMRSPFYDGQDGVKVINLKNSVFIDNHKYVVTLHFIEGFLYGLYLVCCDEEFSFEQEANREIIHNEILRQYGLSQNNEFSWGIIESEYDSKSNVYSINFFYKFMKNVRAV